jgi:hypothetical protein
VYHHAFFFFKWWWGWNPGPDSALPLSYVSSLLFDNKIVIALQTSPARYFLPIGNTLFTRSNNLLETAQTSPTDGVEGHPVLGVSCLTTLPSNSLLRPSLNTKVNSRVNWKGTIGSAGLASIEVPSVGTWDWTLSFSPSAPQFPILCWEDSQTLATLAPRGGKETKFFHSRSLCDNITLFTTWKVASEFTRTTRWYAWGKAAH